MSNPEAGIPSTEGRVRRGMRLLVSEWAQAPGTALVALGLAVFLWANVGGPAFGLSEDQFELLGVLVACAGWLVNIWARLRAQRQAQDRASELRLLADQMPAGVWTTDRNLRLTSVFGTLTSRLENPALRAKGHTLYEIFETRDETHPAIAAHLRALRGESAAYERAVGDLIVEGRVEPLRDARGRVVGCVGALLDVSTWRWAESQVWRHAAMVESSGDAIISTGLDGAIESWNRGAERLYGYAAVEVLGKPVSIIMPKERKGELGRAVATARGGEGAETFETEPVRKNGTRIRVSITISPIKDLRGAVVGISGVSRDITELKRAEEEATRLASFPRLNPMPVVEVDAGGGISYMNPAAERRFPDLRDAPSLHPFVSGAWALVGEGARGAMELHTREVRCRESWYLQHINVLSDGSHLRIYGVDITERRRAEDAVRDSERRFRSVLDRMRLIGVGLDTKGQVNYCNDYLVELTGWSRGDVLGANWFSTFVSPAQSVSAMFALAMETGELPAHYVDDISTRDGGRRTVRWNNTLLHDAEGRIAGAVSIGEDITERRRAEEELLRSREELRALARHLNNAREEEDTRLSREIHDQLGQALTALRLDLSWLGRRLPDAGAAVKRKIGAMVALADETIEAGRRMAAELRPPILDDLGLVAALEWYVADFARRAGLRHELRAEAKDLALDRDLAVVAYRIVQEALTNVARHAQARRVVVRVDRADGSLMLEVRDDGVGIPAEAARSPASLGIAGMRERALARGGTVEVCRSEAGGTAVRVTMPIERRREPREGA